MRGEARAIPTSPPLRNKLSNRLVKFMSFLKTTYSISSVPEIEAAKSIQIGISPVKTAIARVMIRAFVSHVLTRRGFAILETYFENFDVINTPL